MPKRKEVSEEDTRESSSTSPKKKHKRKHKKHKKKKDHGAEGYDDERKKDKSKDKSRSRDKDKDRDTTKDEGKAVTLKITLRGETMATTQMAKLVPVKLPEPIITSGEEEEEEVEEVEEENYQPSWQGSEKDEPELPAKRPGDSDEQEEQKWLDALEKGELDDFGRVKQDKDVSMMTARQRAMLGHEIEGENQLLELPTEPRRKNEDTEEAQKRRKQRAKKRKQQMQKKIEENKTQTVKKLLDREATRSRKEEEKARKRKQVVPHIRYISNYKGFALSFSKGLEFPIQMQSSEAQGPPKPKSTCSAQGCKNLKKYSCSSNNLPVCSMACYKKVQLIPRKPAAVV
ncbi:INO80 complex subunit B [Desmophyllum pertusum]|uniref:INO80 complex subunit B n=1 Tax=Desmophyllum pertusum TaxID=174260 RepID=A0A9W9Z721_9CNID|nr:INO80 complex subunit B [Desmophyllum pertusum]